MKVVAGKEADFAAAKERNSHDFYSASGYRYLEAWADLMEAKLAAGEQVQDIAQSSSREADTEGITGFQYGLAVNVLAHFWVHGEALRRWHNKEYDYEGDGTVNPAILGVTIDSPAE